MIELSIAKSAWSTRKMLIGYTRPLSPLWMMDESMRLRSTLTVADVRCVSSPSMLMPLSFVLVPVMTSAELVKETSTFCVSFASVGTKLIDLHPDAFTIRTWSRLIVTPSLELIAFPESGLMAMSASFSVAPAPIVMLPTIVS